MKKDSKTQLTTLETALQKQFKPDENRLETIMRESYELTAKIQSANIAAIVGFGLLALSIKPIIGHGKFGGWLKETLGGQLSKSTAYSWIEAAKYLIAKVSSAEKLPVLYRLHELLLCQYVYLSAMIDYAHNAGRSRGSAIYHNPSGCIDRPFLTEQFRHARAVGQIQLFKAEVPAFRQLGKTVFFQADIVIIIEIIDTHDRVPVRCQTAGEVEADKTGCAGNKHMHSVLLLRHERDSRTAERMAHAGALP